ncbi:hypothetical protein M758_6G143100 [Ceratodon purpureus]|nr:hypothetical protein M758_6G143100 [Ceratodon purpureus]
MPMKTLQMVQVVVTGCAEEPHLVADSMRLVFATIKVQLFTVANLPLRSTFFMNDAATRGLIYSALSGATSNHWASSRHFTFSIPKVHFFFSIIFLLLVTQAESSE